MSSPGPVPSSSSPHWRTILGMLLLFLVGLLVLAQANPMTTPLGRDAGVYAYGGSQLLRGNLQYISVWENKPPGIFFINAAALVIGRGTRWGIWATELMFLTATAAVGYSLLRRAYGFAAAICGSLVWLVGLALVLEGGNFTEEYSLLFSFTSLLIFTMLIEGRSSTWLHFALGIALGFTLLLRPNNAGAPLAVLITEIVLVLLRQRPARSLRALLLSGVGALLPIAVVAAYFFSNGALSALLDWAFLYGPAYGGHLDVMGALLGGLRNLGLPIGIALVGIWMAFDTLVTQIGMRRIHPLILWLCIDFVLEIILSGLPGKDYPHYFISWLPWMGLASALAFDRLLAASNSVAERFVNGLLVAGILAIAFLWRDVLNEYGRSFINLAVDPSTAEQVDPVARYINEHTDPVETVLAWGGGPGINFLSRRDAPTAQVTYNMLVASPITEQLAREFYEDIRNHPPVLIVDGSGGPASDTILPLSAQNAREWSAAHGVYAPPYLQEFLDLVHAKYSLKTTVVGIPIYRLNP